MEPVAQRILQAAVNLFARKGFAATTTREIIEAAGVTKPMLYYYFESKEGLCRYALTHHLSEFHDHLRASLNAELPPRESLVQFVWQHFDFFQRNQDYARLIHALYFGPDDANINFDLDEHIREGIELTYEAVVRANRDGLIKSGRERDLTMAIKGMIFLISVRLLKHGGAATREDARRVIEDLLEGFGSKN